MSTQRRITIIAGLFLLSGLIAGSIEARSPLDNPHVDRPHVDRPHVDPADAALLADAATATDAAAGSTGPSDCGDDCGVESTGPDELQVSPGRRLAPSQRFDLDVDVEAVRVQPQNETHRDRFDDVLEDLEDAIEDCAEAVITDPSQRFATFRVSFEAGADGSTQALTIEGSGGNEHPAAACVERTLRHVRWPASNVQVRFQLLVRPD